MSTPDLTRFDELVSRYLDASLGDAEEHELVQALSDEALVDRFHEATQLDVEIAEERRLEIEPRRLGDELEARRIVDAPERVVEGAPEDDCEHDLRERDRQRRPSDDADGALRKQEDRRHSRKGQEGEQDQEH